MYRDDLNTVIANVSGLPAISIPAEMFLGKNAYAGDCASENDIIAVSGSDKTAEESGNGGILPLGIQFMGRRGEDDRFSELVSLF